jgi:hypothetical protein
MRKPAVALFLPLYLVVLIAMISSCQFKVSTEKEDEQTEKFAFPKSTDYSTDYLKANFWRLNYNSAGADLAYRIVLPTVMKPTSVEPKPVKDIGITLIGEYQVIDKTQPYLEVQVAYEKVSGAHPDIKSWFTDKLQRLKGTLREESSIKIADKDGYDVLFTRTLKNGEQYISRSSMLVDGENYVIVTVMASKADYEKSAKTIYHILSNWDMQ